MKANEGAFLDKKFAIQVLSSYVYIVNGLPVGLVLNGKNGGNHYGRHLVVTYREIFGMCQKL